MTLSAAADDSRRGGGGSSGQRGLGWLLRSSGLVMAGRVGGVVLGIATQLVLARLLSPADLGVYFVAMALTLVLAAVCTLGYPMLVPAVVARAAADGAHARLAGFMVQARRSLAVVAIAVSTLGVTAIVLWPGLDLQIRMSFVAAVLTAPLLGLMRLHGALANAQRRFTVGYLPDLTLRPLLLIVLIGLLWAFQPGFGLVSVLAGHVAIAAALAVWQMHQVALPTGDAEPAVGATKRETGSDWAGASLRIFPAMIFAAVFTDVTVLITGVFLDAAEIGIFGVALKMSMIAAFAIHTVQQIVSRDLADAVHSDAREDLADVLARTNGVSLALAIAGFLGAVVLGLPVLALFGPAFTAGYASLLILMLAPVVRALAGPAMQVAALTGSERACAPIFITSLVAMGGLSAALIPAAGIAGAALAVVLTTALWSTWLSVAIHRRRGINVAFSLGRAWSQARTALLSRQR